MTYTRGDVLTGSMAALLCATTGTAAAQSSQLNIAAGQIAPQGEATATAGPVDWANDPIILFSNNKPNAKEQLEGLRGRLASIRRVDNVDYAAKGSASQPARRSIGSIAAIRRSTQSESSVARCGRRYFAAPSTGTIEPNVAPRNCPQARARYAS